MMCLRYWCSAGPDGIAALHCRCDFQRALTANFEVKVHHDWNISANRRGSICVGGVVTVPTAMVFEALTQIANMSDCMNTLLA